MDRHPAYIEFHNQDGSTNVVRVMAGIPKIVLHSNYDPITGHMLMNRHRWDEVELDVIEDSDRGHMPFVDWATDIRECDTGQLGFIAPYKKNLKITFIDSERTMELFGCLITSFTQQIVDENDMAYNIFKNYNCCKREVLFEKIGNEKIRVIISITLSIDRANLTLG